MSVGRKYLTDVTWSSVGNMLSARTGLAWDRAADLGSLLSDRVRLLDDDQCRNLVSAALSGTPVVLTWERRGVVEDSIDVTRATVLVRHLSPPALDNEGNVQRSLPGRISISYTGFSHDVYLNRVTNVEMPDNTTATTHIEESHTYGAEG